MHLQGFGIALLIATGLTLRLAFCALVFGLLIGCVAAVAKLSKRRWLVWTAEILTGIVRGSPELIIIFLIYFGGTFVLTQLFHVYMEVSAFAAGVVALGAIFAAYSSETFRGAFLTLDKQQIEAAHAFGMSTTQSFFLIILPQVWRFALPSLGNLWFVLLKDTSLISLLGLTDLMGQAKLAALYTQRPFNFYLAAALIYLILTSLSLVGLRYCEKIANRGVATC